MPFLLLPFRPGLDTLGAKNFVRFYFKARYEGSDPKEKLDSTYTTALAKNWMVWPWVQMTNFKFVPLEHRVLVVNVVSLGELKMCDLEECTDMYTGWNCYLSFLNSQGSPKGKSVEELPPS